MQKYKRKSCLIFQTAFLHKKTDPIGSVKKWSGRRGSNSLPPPWQGGALPDELHSQIALKGENPLKDVVVGASGRNRTNDTRIFSPLLYRLSYRGILWRAIALHSYIMATRNGLEPSTSSVTGWRANRLHHRAKLWWEQQGSNL